MSALTQFGGGSAIPSAYSRIFVSSQIWTAPVTGKVTWIVQGAGGSGALALQSTLSQVMATGGGGGMRSVETIDVIKGQQFIIVVGAGGVALESVGNPANDLRNGNAGGGSSVQGPRVNLLATGGAGGVAATGGTVLGGAGATGTGTGSVVTVPSLSNYANNYANNYA